jgi:hypothetical protein
MKTDSGKVSADIGYADSISVGKAAAFGVTTAVMRDDGDFMPLAAVMAITKTSIPFEESASAPGHPSWGSVPSRRLHRAAPSNKGR